MSTLYDLQGKYASLLELAEDGTTDPEVFAKSKPILKPTKKNVTVSKHELKLINLTLVLFHNDWLKQ